MRTLEQILATGSPARKFDAAKIVQELNVKFEKGRERRPLEAQVIKRMDFFGQRGLVGIDLFAGAGGFTLGATQAGCDVVGVQRATRAIESSRRFGNTVMDLDVSDTAGPTRGAIPLDVLIGGPPCQPYSRGGKRLGQYDPREGFRLVLGTVDTWRPRRLVMENVKDFLAPRHRRFREHIYAELLRRFKHVGAWLLNARDFGVPQARERVFIWAAERPIDPPTPTHGPGTGQPYVTVKEALPHLLSEGLTAIHSFQGGAVSRSVSEPSPTLTTRRNMYAVREPGLTYRGTGSVPKRDRRILYPEETKVLQGFPATFDFVGNLSDQQIQIGNAVPPPLGAAVVSAVTAGLKPRRHTPAQLLRALEGAGHPVYLYEPRPWSDQALIGVTNSYPGTGGPGPLRAVYDAQKLREAVFDANVAAVAQVQGLRPRQVREDRALSQEAFMNALEWMGSQGESGYRADAPVLVPVRSLRALNLPLATALLPPGAYRLVLYRALRARDAKLRTRVAVQQAWVDTLAQHDEIGIAA
jgi:DNA (cytosine-5)-methyltransferase 1